MLTTGLSKKRQALLFPSTENLPQEDIRVNVLFDMDSTVIKSESLEEALYKILLEQNFEKQKIEEIMSEIKDATNAGMAKRMPLSETIPLRLSILNRHRVNISQDQLSQMEEYCKQDIIEGVREMIQELKTEFGNKIRLVMISGGDVSWVKAVCEELGIEEYAGNIINVKNGAFDPKTSRIEDSKIPATWRILGNELRPENTIINGDGGTDLQLWDEGLAKFFIGNLIVAEEEDRPNITALENACACDNYAVIRDVEKWKIKLKKYIRTILGEGDPDQTNKVDFSFPEKLPLAA